MVGPWPSGVVTDNGPCFRGGIYAEVFRGEDPLLRHVRTRVRSPQTKPVVALASCRLDLRVGLQLSARRSW